jgi:hypothetical protein
MEVKMLPKIVFARLSVSLASLVIAGGLAFYERKGWGWFIFASILFGVFSITSDAFKLDDRSDD